MSTETYLLNSQRGCDIAKNMNNIYLNIYFKKDPFALL